MEMLKSICDCLNSPEHREINRKNRIINRDINSAARAELKTTRILLLGAGASGKSTIIKQMKIIHGNGFGENEKNGYKITIFQNLCLAMMRLVKAMETYNYTYEDDDNEQNAEEFMDWNTEMEEGQKLRPYDDEYVYINRKVKSLTIDQFDCLTSLWEDSGIQKVYKEKRNIFGLPDSTKYYFDSMDRIRKQTYEANEDDILHARLPTRGIAEYDFGFKGVTIRMVDVGGQKGERKKWVNCFEKVSSIMFLASLSGYDEAETEYGGDEGDNKLNLALDIFTSVVAYEIFKNTSVILFLNKKDIFEEKIQKSNIVDYFNTYTGPTKDHEKGRDFICELFVNAYQRTHDRDNEREAKTFFSHFTVATDTENIKFVFNATKDIILRRIMDEVDLA